MDQFSHLVELADPKHDSERGAESYVPGIVFRGGGHSVATRRVSYSSSQTSPGVFIRPAIVAANICVQRIPWHEKTSKAQDWQHFLEEEIDLLDEACERLFGNCEMEAGTE